MRVMRVTAARLGVGELYDEIIAAGGTVTDVSVLEARQARDVAAARRAAEVYARTVGARMPALPIACTAPRASASAPVRHGGHYAMPPLTFCAARRAVPARADAGHAPMPPLTLAPR